MFADDMKVICMSNNIKKFIGWSSEHLVADRNLGYELLCQRKCQHLQIFTKSSFQAARVTAKARQMLSMINSAVAFFTTDIFVHAYLALVRSHLEYYIRAWSPSQSGNMKKTGSLQCADTRMILGLQQLSYGKILCGLTLSLLECFGVSRHLIRVFEMVNGLTKLQANRLFYTRPPRCFFEARAGRSLQALAFTVFVKSLEWPADGSNVFNLIENAQKSFR